MLLRLVAEQGIVNANLGKEHQTTVLTTQSLFLAGSQIPPDNLRLFLFQRRSEYKRCPIFRLRCTSE